MLNLLRQHGFKAISIKGLHCKLGHPDGRTTIVPVHSKKEWGKGLENAILKQEGLRQLREDNPVKEFPRPTLVLPSKVFEELVIEHCEVCAVQVSKNKAFALKLRLLFNR
jgi:predicted RNA binding protein YcfA (HicA-like mRNA interferase family)